MRVDLFDFSLPEACIAQWPAQPRDAARLLEIRPDILTDYTVRELPGLLAPGDVMVVNNTRVIPALLTGVRRRGAHEARVAVTLHRRFWEAEETAAITWEAFARPAKRLRAGDRLYFGGEGFCAGVSSCIDGGRVRLRFDMETAAFHEALARYGRPPLPPYIRRGEQASKAQDDRDYQTAFAVHPGAVAAPTAGLHFTPELLTALDAQGVRRAAVTLHVGAGTFLPVKAEDTRDHRMHSEYLEISPEVADIITNARREGRRIIAVGTTSLRALEAATDVQGITRPFAGETDIFITPGYTFRAVDVLMTNFHLPRSTLFMLVSAFSGLERIHTAYAHAIREGYRFYSYGDACLLYRHASSYSHLP